ncbi:oligosaccharide flippase family protein [bacterium]|nr:oligosaccharide flippase family protein [bacterium]
MSSIARNTATDSAAQVIGILFSLGAGVVLARFLGDEGRGQYVYATTFVGQLMFSLANMGMELSCSSLLSRDRSRLSEIHSIVLCLCTALFVVAAAVAGLFHETIRATIFPGLKLHGLLAIAFALPFWVYQSGAYGMLIGIGAVRTRAVYELCFNFAQNLGMVLLLVYTVGSESSSVVHVLTLTYYGLVILGAFALWCMLLFRGARWKDPKIGAVREFLGFGGWVWFGNLGSNIGQRVDQYFVQLVGGGMAAFGVYTLAASLTQRTQIFPQALTRSAYAQLGALPTDEAALLTAQCFRQMLALGLLLILVGAAASPIIPVVYTAEFSGAILPFIVFLVGRLFGNCSWMLANFFTGHLGKPRVPMLATWAIVPLQALGAWWAMGLGSLTAVAGVVATCNLLLLLVFLRLFLRSQQTVSLGQLLRLGKADVEPWQWIIRQVFRKVAGTARKS